MLTTLSSERNEQLLCEWSGEITDRHAQDFCDVCNAVFSNHFDLDYMRRKYEANIYGRSFIAVVYKNAKPIAAWGAWRNDLEGKTAFQLCDFVTLPEARKGGYVLDMFNGICDELRKSYPEAVIYGYPGPMAYPVLKAIGFSVTDLYMRLYHGYTKDFAENISVIDDDYVNAFLTKKKNICISKIGGRYYLVQKFRIKRLIPAARILGEVSSKFSDSFRRAGGLRLYFYNSLLPGKRTARAAEYDLGASEQVMKSVPPYYKADGNTLDFNGRNNH